MAQLRKTTIETAVSMKAIKPAEFERLIVDSTVQEKAIAHPTDSRLLEVAREKIVRVAQRAGIKLKLTHQREGRMLLLPLDDLLVVVREFINPAVSRSGLDRCLRRHGAADLRELQAQARGDADADAGEAEPAIKTFKDDEPGFVHMNIKYLPQRPDEAARRYPFVAPSPLAHPGWLAARSGTTALLRSSASSRTITTLSCRWVCATENLVQAALAYGLRTRMRRRHGPTVCGALSERS